MINSSQKVDERKANYLPNYIYEWRVFWSDADLIPPLKQIFTLQIKQIQTLWKKDRYLLVQGCPHNIKIRQGTLQIKQLIDTHNGYQVFAPKRVLKFPLTIESVADVWRELEGIKGKIADCESLTKLLQESGYRYQWIEVKKKRCKVKWQTEATTLDVSYLLVDGEFYWSVCLEKKKATQKFDRGDKMLFQKSQAESYPDFLRKLKLMA